MPEWQATLDEVLVFRRSASLSDSPGGHRDRCAPGRVDPRIAAAGLFAGSYVPRATMDEARRVTIPLHVLLQWDDEGNDRRMALDLFDAFGSAEKTLTPTWAVTQASHHSRARTPPASSPAISARQAADIHDGLRTVGVGHFAGDMSTRCPSLEASGLRKMMLPMVAAIMKKEDGDRLRLLKAYIESTQV